MERDFSGEALHNRLQGSVASWSFEHDGIFVITANVPDPAELYFPL
jgi:hypothetical protein